MSELFEMITFCLIFAIPFIIISLIVTACLISCNPWDFGFYLIFNFLMAFIYIFPPFVFLDYWIYFEEFFKISEDDTAKFKTYIKNFYKLAHWFFYLSTDLVIPFLSKFYLLNYKKKICGFRIKLSVFSGLIFFVIFVVAAIIGIVIIILTFPEPKIDDIEKNYQGLDGFIFNFRNAISFAYLESNIILAFIILNLKFYEEVFSRIISCICCSRCIKIEYTERTFDFLALGILTDENTNKNSSGENND